MNKLAPEM